MATIKDIAHLTGLSSATISRILNGDLSLNVPIETRNNVLEAAKKLNYQKKRKPKTNFNLGIVQWYSLQQEIDDPYYLSIRQGVEEFARKHNLSIVRAFKSDINYLELLKNIDGIVCIGKFNQDDINHFKNISKNIIFLDMTTKIINEHTITLDFDQAIKDVIEYLSSLGHHKIGYLGGKEYLDENSVYPDTRRIAFEKYCDKYQIDYHEYILEDKFTSESGYNMMVDLIHSNKLPTALFAASDPLAIGAMRAIAEHNLKIPEDISLIGFDDISSASYTNPPLTSVFAPAFNMGEYGASIVYSNLNTTPMKIILPCTLIERESCIEIKR